MLKTLFKSNLAKNISNVLQISIRHNCKLPAIVMNNGNEMPIIGFGTWSSTNDFRLLEVDCDTGPERSGNKNKCGDVKKNSEKVAASVGVAINAGYRHIDSAHFHKNEREIGQVLKKKIEDGVVTRQDLFITSKLWNTFHHPENVSKACQQTLDNLCIDYLDMYLMHSPMGFEYTEDDLFPMEEGDLLCSDVDYIDTWSAMEVLVEKGKCKNIGVSNFNIEQIKRLLKKCKIIPQTLQIEMHPYLTQPKLVKFAKCNDICLTAYAPIGSPKRPWAKPNDKILLKDYKILQLAEKHGRSPAQILLRFQVQCGIAVIPAARERRYIEQNINIFDFELSPEDVQNIKSLNHNLRYFEFSGAYGHPYHPFEESL